VNVSFSKKAAVIGVTVKPGATALTRAPSWRPVDRQRARQGRDRALARGVGSLRGQRDERCLLGEVDDRPARGAERRPECLAGVQGAEHVDLEVALEVVGRELVDGPVLGQDAGGVDQDIELRKP
jgi:hypothetical protein